MWVYASEEHGGGGDRGSQISSAGPWLGQTRPENNQVQAPHPDIREIPGSDRRAASRREGIHSAMKVKTDMTPTQKPQNQPSHWG